MHIAIHHVQRLRLSQPVREIHVECQMEPRAEGGQGLVSFNLRTRPRTRPFRTTDALGNAIHALDNPREVSDVVIVADAVVSLNSSVILPAELGEEGQVRLKASCGRGDFWDYLQPTDLTRVSRGVLGFIEAQALDESKDPAVSLRRLVATIHRLFEPIGSPDTDASLDRAIAQARLSPGLAAHLVIAIARLWGIPARLASGLNVATGQNPEKGGSDGKLVDRSVLWPEVYLPDMEWIGLDPLGGQVVGLGHVKLAVGRDQADLPRLKYVFKGEAEVELTRAVTIGSVETVDGEADDALLDRSLSQLAGDDRPQRKRPAHLQAAQQQH